MIKNNNTIQKQIQDELQREDLKSIGLRANYYFEHPDSLSKILESEDYSHKFYSVEIFCPEKLIVLKDCLFDLSRRNPRNKKILNSLFVISDICNKSIKSQVKTTVDEYRRIMSYGYASEYKIGRLYSFITSLTSLPRQERFYLFKDIYDDIDLVNSHPSILYEYSLINKLECSVLKMLVERRADFMDVVSKESNIKISDVKKQIIICINNVDAKSNSKLLNLLMKEIKEIQDCMWKEMGHEDSKYYKHVVLKQKENFFKKSLSKRKNTIRTMYCFEKETDLVLELRDFILKRVRLIHPDYDELDIEAPLSIVPFFDGFYINKDYQIQINHLVEKYNENQNIYKFSIKPIEPNWSYLNPELLNTYEKIQRLWVLLSTKKTNLIPFLIQKVLFLKPFEFSEKVLDLIEADLKENSILKNKKERLKLSTLEQLKKESNIFMSNVRISLIPIVERTESLENWIKIIEDQHKIYNERNPDKII